MTKARTSMILVFILIALNIVDLILHIAINQPELLRITSNIFIITSGILLVAHHRYSLLFTVALALYVGLNTLFILLYGIGAAGALFITATTLLGIFAVRPTLKHVQ